MGDVTRARSPAWPITLATVLVLGLIVLMRRSPTPMGDDPLLACPSSSFLIARVDLAALRKSALGEAVDPLLRALLPVPKAMEGCALEPAWVQSLALAVPSGDDRTDLGLALRVVASRNELERCQAALTRHASTAKDAGSERYHGFELMNVGDARADTLGAAPNGLVLLAPRPWARTMAEAVSAPQLSAATAGPHHVPRALTGGPPPTLFVSVVLSAATRERVRAELAREEGGRAPEAGGRKAEARDEGRTMASVLAVGSASLSLVVAEETDAELRLFCDTANACADVGRLWDKKRGVWSQSPVVKLLGLGPLVDGLTATEAGQTLLIRARIPTLSLKSAVERALAFRRMKTE